MNQTNHSFVSKCLQMRFLRIIVQFLSFYKGSETQVGVSGYIFVFLSALDMFNRGKYSLLASPRV